MASSPEFKVGDRGESLPDSVIDLDKPFIDEVDSLLAKYGSSINVITRRYNPQANYYAYSFAYMVDIRSEGDVIRQELLQAFEDGFRYIESIGFAGSFVVFTPKLL